MDRVLCVVKTMTNLDREYSEDELLDLQYSDNDTIQVGLFKKTYKLVIPLYDHPHNDVENGQPWVHYHQDLRYSTDFFEYAHLFKCYKHGRFSTPKKEHNEWLEYRFLNISEEKIFLGTTPTSLISKSKLKHKCVHKGKCPHRGYDLSKEVPDADGIITCPLHGLKFDKNNNLINGI